MEERLPIENLKLKQPPRTGGDSKLPPKPRRTERFLKGPIPWPWLVRAVSLPGKAAAMAIALWHWIGLKKSRTVRVVHKDLRELGVGAKAAGRSLRALEQAGLVSVDRGPGRSPVVTVLDVPENPAVGRAAPPSKEGK